MTVEVSMQGELGIAVEDSSEQVHGGVSVHNGVVQSVFVTVVVSVVESVLLAVVRSEHVHSAPVVVIGESVVSGVFGVVGRLLVVLLVVLLVALLVVHLVVFLRGRFVVLRVDLGLLVFCLGFVVVGLLSVSQGCTGSG